MELQETRRHIVEILKAEESCTVEEIVEKLSERLSRAITTVTVRHHLERLRAEALVEPPRIRRRNTPGRPQYVYSLSQRALEYFPNDYAMFASELVVQLKKTLPGPQINVIFNELADRMADEAMIPDASLPVRLNYVVNYLNSHGYDAAWEHDGDGYMLTTNNCPFERVAVAHEELCMYDSRLMTSMLGVTPRLVTSVRDGSSHCKYFVPPNGK